MTDDLIINPGALPPRRAGFCWAAGWLTVLLMTIASTGGSAQVLTTEPATDTPNTAETDPTVLDTSTLYEMIHRASIEVLVDGRLAGSGIVVREDGRALTACHVVWPGDGEIEVMLPDRRRVSAQIIAIDRGHDLALLALPADADDYDYLPLRDTPTAPGADVYLFGAPIFRHATMLHGTVARAEPTFEFQPTDGAYIRCLHIQGSAPRGTSAGHVIGIQSGQMLSRDAPQGVVFAAPAGPAIALLDRGRSQRTPTLGMALEELWEQGADDLDRWPRGQSGVVPVRITPDSPADRAGLSRNTLIVAIDGRVVIYRDDVMSAVRNQRPGSRIAITILRPNGQRSIVELTLGLLEDGWLGE